MAVQHKVFKRREEVRRGSDGVTVAFFRRRRTADDVTGVENTGRRDIYQASETADQEKSMIKRKHSARKCLPSDKNEHDPGSQQNIGFARGKNPGVTLANSEKGR